MYFEFLFFQEEMSNLKDKLNEEYKIRNKISNKNSNRINNSHFKNEESDRSNISMEDLVN